MFKSCAPAIVFAAVMAPLALTAAPPVYKCTIKGTVTYQSDPCPSGEARNHPTVEQLNAERKKRLSQPSDGAAGPTAPTLGGPGPPSLNVAPGVRAPTGQERAAAVVGPMDTPTVSFKCDGRKCCSQMTSCAEAKYFLAYCPAVKMDGNRDGIPCELQWCNS